MENNTLLTFKHDGMEYQIDMGDLTGREDNTLAHYVPRYRGVNGISQMFIDGSTALLAICLGLAMKRSGNKNVDFEKLLDIESKNIDVVLPEKPIPTDDQDGPQPSEESTESDLGSSTTLDQAKSKK